MDKILVETLVDDYKKIKTEALKKSYLEKTISINPYISYGVKHFLADKIIKNTSFVDDNDNEKVKKFKINTPKRYVLSVYTIITCYTNIQMSEDNVISDFDLLNQYGLIDKIFSLIPETEIEEFKSIIDMAASDFITNYYEPKAFIERQLNELATLVETSQPIIDGLLSILQANEVLSADGK